MPEKKAPRRFMRVLRNLMDLRRLRRICRRLGITLYPWQRRFILGLDERLEYPPGRQTGKTTAVLLRLLTMRNDDYLEAFRVLHCDPDYIDGYMTRHAWYSQEYRRLAELCGVEPRLEFRRFAFLGVKTHDWGLLPWSTWRER